MVEIFYRPKATDYFQEKNISSDGPELGTGHFLLPDPASGPGKVQSIAVPDLTNEQFLARAHGCIEATWVPNVFGTWKERQGRPDSCGSRAFSDHS
jgi:hypothetical protein